MQRQRLSRPLELEPLSERCLLSASSLFASLVPNASFGVRVWVNQTIGTQLSSFQLPAIPDRPVASVEAAEPVSISLDLNAESVVLPASELPRHVIRTLEFPSVAGSFEDGSDGVRFVGRGIAAREWIAAPPREGIAWSGAFSGAELVRVLPLTRSAFPEDEGSSSGPSTVARQASDGGTLPDDRESRMTERLLTRGRVGDKITHHTPLIPESSAKTPASTLLSGLGLATPASPLSNSKRRGAFPQEVNSWEHETGELIVSFLDRRSLQSADDMLGVQERTPIPIDAPPTTEVILSSVVESEAPQSSDREAEKLLATADTRSAALLGAGFLPDFIPLDLEALTQGVESILTQLALLRPEPLRELTARDVPLWLVTSAAGGALVLEMTRRRLGLSAVGGSGERDWSLKRPPFDPLSPE